MNHNICSTYASEMLLLVAVIAWSYSYKTQALSADWTTIEVNTTAGSVIGWSIPTGSDVPGRQLEVFLGIPYAEPPVGALRFAPTVAKSPWTTAINATHFSPICPQQLSFVHRYSFPKEFNNTDEDCLYVNLYSPKYGESTSLLPVMVWLHGGAYRYGAGQEYDGRTLALNGVVVGPPMIAAWAPRVDGYFLKQLPEDLLAQETYQYVPMFTGTVQEESADEAEDIPDIAVGFNLTYLTQLIHTWSRRYGAKADQVKSAVGCEYSDTNTSLARNRELYIEVHAGNIYSFPKEFNNTDEDCLYLNLYSPKYGESTSLLPVMVWLHGGAYRYGAGQEYDGRTLALNGVVVVTFNFRLGVLGYLSTDDNVAPGNYGLLDQVMALQWIRDNIHNFRGDPDKVTIFGESSGGGSVSLHGFSDLSKGLFRSIIPQSGCALSPWAVYRPPHHVMSVTKQLAVTFNCSTETSSAILECLRDIPANRLVMTKVSGPPMIAAWAPRVDGYFLKQLPEDLLAQETYQYVPMFTGTVQEESADEAEDIPDIAVGFNLTYLTQLIHTWSRRYGAKADQVKSAVGCEYSDTNTSLARNRELYIEMKSDYGYVAPHQRLAEGYISGQPEVWMYSFQYRSQHDPSPPWMGVYHGMELYYLFGDLFAKELPCPWGCINIQPDYAQWTDRDRRTSKAIMEIWTNFAKTGNPNPVPYLQQNLTEFNKEQQQYLLIENNPVVRQKLKPGRMEFWNRKIPKLLQGEITINEICKSNTAPTRTSVAVFIASLALSATLPF